VTREKSFSATGRRKSATAQVLFTPGSGDFRINSKPANEYLQNDSFLVASVQGPLDSVALPDSFDIHVQVEGGGLVGQAMAIRLGLARALTDLLPPSRAKLKQSGFLTRDSRVKNVENTV